MVGEILYLNQNFIRTRFVLSEKTCFDDKRQNFTMALDLIQLTAFPAAAV
jgi:hypothetical protein